MHITYAYVCMLLTKHWRKLEVEQAGKFHEQLGFVFGARAKIRAFKSRVYLNADWQSSSLFLELFIGICRLVTNGLIRQQLLQPDRQTANYLLSFRKCCSEYGIIGLPSFNNIGSVLGQVFRVFRYILLLSVSESGFGVCLFPYIKRNETITFV